jgi:hypothetical protein
MNLTREEAIIINNNKCNEGVISYIEGVGPLYERNIAFLTKKNKTRNTETFIMINRANLLDAYLLEKKRELEEIRRRENAISWVELIEQEKAKALQKSLQKKQAKIIKRRLEEQQQKKQENKYNDDLIFKFDEPLHKTNHCKNALNYLLKLSRF